jgi:hypothetical protein
MICAMLILMSVTEETLTSALNVPPTGHTVYIDYIMCIRSNLYCI